MFKIVVFLTLLCYLNKPVYSLQIKYYTISWSSQNINISTTELIPDKVGVDNVKILTATRTTPEDEVELLADFPYLEKFEMEINQEFVPDFKNLMKIKHIALDKNNFGYIKKESFSDLSVERLSLSHNKISKIENRSFGNNLKSLTLKCNNLKTFSSKWFKNVSSLEELEMGGNLLTKIEPYLFKPHKNLKDIVLSYNAITSIGEGAFRNRNNFYFFYLPYNNIKEISPNIFVDGQIRINNFAINNNNLTFLAPELLEKLKILTSISLDDNPWQCKCWEIIKNWVPDYLRIFRDSERPVCVASLSFSEHCVPFVDKELIEHFSENSDPPHYNKSWYCDDH